MRDSLGNVTKIESVAELNDAYRALYQLDDERALPLLAAVFANAKTRLRHVWLYLIGSASSGKTTMLEAFAQVPYAEFISDVTENTLLSGARSATGETSLLLRLGDSFVVVMKDFTTLLSKQKDTRDRIMGQLREVYDGYLRKETGLGVTIEWGKKEAKLRSVFIMATTEAIYRVQAEFAELGARGLNYVLPNLDKASRKRMAKVAMANARAQDTGGQARLQAMVAEYVRSIVTTMPAEPAPLPDDLADFIVDAAEFATAARSIVARDFKGDVQLVLSPENPARVATQLQAVATILIHMNGGSTAPWIKETVGALAVDCVPKQLKEVLRFLAVHPAVTKAGASQRTGYPPERCESWLDDLCMLKVARKRKVGNAWYYSMGEDYRQLLLEQMRLERSSENAEGDDDHWDRDAQPEPAAIVGRGL